jgi:hypothetical protein
MCFCYAHRRLCIVSSRHGRPDRMEWKTAINVLLFYLVLVHTMRFSLVFVFPIINCYLSLFIPQFTIDNSKRACNQLWASPALLRLSWLWFLFCHERTRKIQMVKTKRTNNDPQNTTQKTDWGTRTLQKKNKNKNKKQKTKPEVNSDTYRCSILVDSTRVNADLDFECRNRIGDIDKRDIQT